MSIYSADRKLSTILLIKRAVEPILTLDDHWKQKSKYLQTEKGRKKVSKPLVGYFQIWSVPRYEYLTTQKQLLVTLDFKFVYSLKTVSSQVQIKTHTVSFQSHGLSIGAKVILFWIINSSLKNTKPDRTSECRAQNDFYVIEPFN